MWVHTREASWVVPPHRALWLPAGTGHSEELHAPVSVRTLFLAPGVATGLPRHCCVLNVSSFLRELILRVSRIGALDRMRPVQAHLINVLLDELVSISDVPLQLPMPRDPRALRLAEAWRKHPDDEGSVESLSGEAGASRRTMERLFLAETGMTVGEWRRRLRLLHAVSLLAGGESVTNVAIAAGYSRTRAFIATFNKAFGTTPSRISLSG